MACRAAALRPAVGLFHPGGQDGDLPRPPCIRHASHSDVVKRRRRDRGRQGRGGAGGVPRADPLQVGAARYLAGMMSVA
jgi:hypothetical protein